jgi:hypothetical protein
MKFVEASLLGSPIWFALAALNRWFVSTHGASQRSGMDRICHFSMMGHFRLVSLNLSADVYAAPVPMKHVRMAPAIDGMLKLHCDVSVVYRDGRAC